MQTPPLAVRLLPGRGRGLVTTRDVAAGETVLAEEPLLLTVAADAVHAACANCLAWLTPAPLACQACQQAAFCSAQCQQQAGARPWVHAAATCRAYSRLQQLLPGDLEAQASLRFLIQAAALKAASQGGADGLAQQCAAGYQVLLQLCGDATPAVLQAAAALQPALCAAVGDESGSLLPLPEVAALLAKEQHNSYGLLAPPQLQPQPGDDASAEPGGRRLRGSGIWPLAAMLNHECLPNVARFDALDGGGGGPWPAQWPGRDGALCPPPPALPAGTDASTAAALAAAAGLSAGPVRSSAAGAATSTTLLVLRALHALPAGTEAVGCYVPLNWDLEERQAQAQAVYGFACRCPRCLLESSPEWQADNAPSSGSGDWETDSAADEGPAADEAGADEAHEPQREQPMLEVPAAQQPVEGQPQERLDAAYLSLFLLKYMCPRDGCCGAMAALLGAEACECSVCGATRSDAAFLAELEQAG